MPADSIMNSQQILLCCVLIKLCFCQHDVPSRCDGRNTAEIKHSVPSRYDARNAADIEQSLQYQLLTANVQQKLSRACTHNLIADWRQKPSKTCSSLPLHFCRMTLEIIGQSIKTQKFKNLTLITKVFKL